MIEEKKAQAPLRRISMLEGKTITRREFIEQLGLGGGALVLLAGCGLKAGSVSDPSNGEPVYAFIAVDYTKCTGCRTCETVCSAHNHQQIVNGETLNGLGNPELANIRVYGNNPDVDIPAVCAMCPDSPCVEACPVDPETKTGRKALYREGKNLTIKNDPQRCITCGSCSEACRVGVIRPNAETNIPERMCTLCNGDPQCVKYCPFGALSLIRVDAGQKFYAMKPEQIAEQLMHEWYDAAK
jgi:Fe-S-cluster-containing hydrogenase component 2